jgi:Ca-activated chloride channel family protein
MSRTIQLLFLFAFTLAFGTAPALLVVPPEHAQELPDISIKRQDIHTTIDGVLARTTVQQVLHNRGSRAAEGSLLIPIPKGAQVTDFSLMMDGKKVSAELLDTGEARRIYESIVRRQRDPGLLEYVDAQTYRVRLFPIPAGGDMEMELQFAQPVERTTGLYTWRFEPLGQGMTVSPESSTFDVTITSKEKLGLVSCTTHEARIDRADDGLSAKVTVPGGLRGSSAFALLFGMEGRDVAMHLVAHRRAGEEKGTFLLMLSPPRTGVLAEAMRKDVVFVLDTSGSMSDDGKFEKAISALKQCLNALGDGDEFAVMTFATDVDSFRAALVPATKDNIKAAQEWLANRAPKGGTNIHDSLVSAGNMLPLRKPGENVVQQIIFMTDGLPTVGKTDQLQIIAGYEGISKNAARVFTLGFGYDVNTHLLDALADKTRALSDYVEPKEDLESVVTSLFQAISAPVLTDLEISADGLKITDVYPKKLPDLFAGRDLMIVGSYTGEGQASLKLSGRAKGEPYKEEVAATFAAASDEKTAYVRAIWAGRKVGYLLDEIRQNGESKELKDEVIALAKEYNLVTPYTSYLVAQDEEYASTSPTGTGNAPQPVGGLPTGWNPTQGTSSDGSVMRSSSAMSAKSGGEAVRFAKELREEKDRLYAPAEPGSRVVRERSGGESVAINGKSFHRADAADPWVQDSPLPRTKVVRIQYLSDAYYELLAKFPLLKKEILLGESVELVIGDTWVLIGAEGEAEKCPL